MTRDESDARNSVDHNITFEEAMVQRFNDDSY